MPHSEWTLSVSLNSMGQSATITGEEAGSGKLQNALKMFLTRYRCDQWDILRVAFAR
jgi:hypothetical protein